MFKFGREVSYFFIFLIIKFVICIRKVCLFENILISKIIKRIFFKNKNYYTYEITITTILRSNNYFSF